jgi:HEXXH motif-containing protein
MALTADQLKELTEPAENKTQTLAALADWSEQNLLRPLNLNHAGYSTSKMLNPFEFIVHKQNFHKVNECGCCFQIESLPPSLFFLAEDQGASLKIMQPNEINETAAVLRDALKVIDLAAPVFTAAIGGLLRSVHILNTHHPDFDVSFTLPELPHSIFLSVPSAFEDHAVVRTAEAMIHEVLHLQLALVERQEPLTHADSQIEFTYAPWRDEERPISGVIHGLFVFWGIEFFYSHYLKSADPQSLPFIKDRILQIAGQRNCIVQPEKFKSLTPFGLDLLQRLLRKHTK